MKNYILIFIFIFPLFISAQENKEKSTRSSIAVNFSPNYCYRTLKYSSQSQALKYSFEEYEHPGFGFNTGIAFDFSFSKRFEVEAGVQYSRQTRVFKNLPLYNSSAIKLGTLDEEIRYNYLEVPLRVNFRFLDKKLFIYTFAGGSMNILLNDKI